MKIRFLFAAFIISVLFWGLLSLPSQGATVIFGSSASDEPVSVSVTVIGHNGVVGGVGFSPGESVSLYNAIDGATTGTLNLYAKGNRRQRRLRRPVRRPGRQRLKHTYWD